MCKYFFFFFKQKTAYEITVRDWSSDVCSSDLYPGDNTPVCTRQFCSYRDHAEELGDLDAVVVGISGQDLDSHAGFVAKHGLNVPLLADVDGAVAKLYGAHRPVVGTSRAVVVIDADGVV